MDQPLILRMGTFKDMEGSVHETCCAQMTTDADGIAYLPSWALPMLADENIGCGDDDFDDPRREQTEDEKEGIYKVADGTVPDLLFHLRPSTAEKILQNFDVYSSPKVVDDAIRHAATLCFAVKRNRNAVSHYVLFIPGTSDGCEMYNMVSRCVSPENVILEFNTEGYTAIVLKPAGFEELSDLANIMYTDVLRPTGTCNVIMREPVRSKQKTDFSRPGQQGPRI